MDTPGVSQLEVRVQQKVALSQPCPFGFIAAIAHIRVVSSQREVADCVHPPLVEFVPPRAQGSLPGPA